MIKFFRRIRQNLLSEGKTGKYFKYAIGEVVLVVIGILIALQVNNWNEQRKQKQNYLNIIRIIKNDLMIDTLNINQVIGYYEELEYAFLLSKNDTIILDDYLKCDKCPRIISGFMPVFLQNKGYNLLESFNLNKTTEKDSLNLRLSVYYSTYNLAVGKAVKSCSDLFTEYTNIIRESKPWFKDWYEGKHDNDFYEFVLHDPIYKNRIAQYYFYIYKYYLRILKESKTEQEKILQTIDARLMFDN